MLVNFCDCSLRTDVTCSTVSTEGYEVENLVSNSEKGFLAYACIKPPVSVDFSFICNIQISHVIVWPQTGAQKSCGFHLSVKSTDSKNEPFIDVSTAFLNKEENGVLFYRRDIKDHTVIPVPSTFLKRYIKTMNVVNYVNVLRLKIVKTDNSVPALRKVEIWGAVSPKCGKDVASNVTALWMNRCSSFLATQNFIAPVNETTKQSNDGSQEQGINLLNVPEDFLDPITCEIMTQPIILPSGKIIDHKTLEKHGQMEATWGRPVSDPFTGIRFSETRKPLAALSLKARIDKFLLENSSAGQVKQLPRVLGSSRAVAQLGEDIKLITCKATEAVITSSNSGGDGNLRKRLAPINDTCHMSIKKFHGPFHGHSLPVASIRNSTRQTVVVAAVKSSTVSKQEIVRQNAAVQEKLESSIRVSSTPTCSCCTSNIFYKLPCDHVICRKVLLSLERTQCTLCHQNFEKSDLSRFHFPPLNS